MKAVRRLAAGIGTVLVFGAGACGIERLPARFVRPEFPGETSSFRCAAKDTRRLSTTDVAVQAPFAFTDPLTGWRAEGVFANGQPVLTSTVPAKEIRPRWPKREAQGAPMVPLGGSYWLETPYPMARAGTNWVSSAFSRRDGAVARGTNEATGTLTSTTPFTIDHASRYLHLSIGGDRDLEDVRVEMQVRLRGSTDAERQADRLQLETCDEQRGGAPPPAPDGDFVTVLARAGDGRAPMTPTVVPLGPCLFLLNGREARIRIVDESRKAHISVADVFFSKTPNLPRGPAVWGFADYHTHPAAHVGFGGLRGIHTIWGAPGRSIDEYVPASPAADARMARDLPSCDAHADPKQRWSAHHGGLAASKMINLAEYRTSHDTSDLLIPELADQHGQSGAPSYANFPDFRAGSHQQYHISQIYRAYLGGLRLLSALAVHNRGLEYGMGWVTCGKDGRPRVETTPDLAVVEAHVQVMRELEALNGDWMKIAYTPNEAREIIASNKLAVVLGVEVGQLGQPDEGQVGQQVERLARLGIRQVTPIHANDNALGGAAVFQDLYNSVNDFLNRPEETRDQVVEVSGAFINQPFGPHAFFEVEDAGDRAEPVRLRLVNPRRIVISDTFPRSGPCSFHVPLLDITSGCLHPFVNVSPHGATPVIVYNQAHAGHVNALGLTGRGKEYVGALMSRGMLIDLAHMSDKSREQTLESSVDLGCGDYPLMFSHAGFRQLPFLADHSHRTEAFLKKTREIVLELSGKKPPNMSSCVKDGKCDKRLVDAAKDVMGDKPLDPGSVNRGLLPKEFDVPTQAVQAVDQRGGVVGVFLGQDPVDSRRLGTVELPFANDCAGSSKSFAAALLFAAAHHPKDGVGIASDFVMHMTVAPRFGDHACALYLKAGSGSESGLQLLETLVNPGQYRFVQTAPVRYRPAGTEARPPAAGPDDRLEPYRLGKKTFDFNVHGLAHYGLLPDMLQDVKNLGVSDLAPLFRSAQGYVDMWEKAWVAAGCDGDPAACDPSRPPLVPEGTCGDNCPTSWNGGAPLQSRSELDREICAPGEEIALPGARLKFASRRDPSHGLLRRQGDWAVFRLPAKPWLWRCGGDPPEPLACPDDTQYVKVRRVFESRVAANLTCDEPPSYWMGGSRRVIFDCLAGPPQ